MATKKGKSAKTRSVKPVKPAKPNAKPAKTAKAKPAPAAVPPRPPARAHRPTMIEDIEPARPPAPPPSPPRDELLAPRDIGRLTRYGERFGGWKIDTRLLQNVQLPVASGALAICDPGAPKSWRVLDRPSGSGQFRVMLSVARDDAGKERVAALTIYVGRPPIAKWTVAHYKGQKKPKSPDQLPRCAVTTGWIALADAGAVAPGAIAVPTEPSPLAPIEVVVSDGRHALAIACEDGEYAAYWAVDPTDKPICIVIDFDVFTQKEWKARPA